MRPYWIMRIILFICDKTYRKQLYTTPSRIQININIQETSMNSAIMYTDQCKHTGNNYVQRPHVYISI